MGEVPDVAALSAAATSLHTLLRAALDAAQRPSGAPEEWGRVLAEATAAAATAEDCRDMLLVLARRPGPGQVSWPKLVTHSGIPKSTLEHRYLSYVVRGALA